MKATVSEVNLSLESRIRSNVQLVCPTEVVDAVTARVLDRVLGNVRLQRRPFFFVGEGGRQYQKLLDEKSRDGQSEEDGGDFFPTEWGFPRPAA